MITKKFISFYFSSTGLLILELSSNRKKLKVAHRIDLPSGVIIDYKVTNVEVLAELIAALKKKLKIKQKSVGVVIPEFTALTKTLEIPSIDKSDLDEAIEWQIQEFLPWSIENTLYDWKLIKEDKDKFLVLLVAVEKSVITGYADAVSKAGFLPLVVETPSLSLVRLSKSGDIGKLIFYMGKSQSLVILTQGEKFINSSVSSAGTQEELIDAAKKMLQHYKDIEVKSVELGGQALTSDFAKNLSQEFGIKVTLLGEKFSQMSKDVLQKFLIPISLQFKDPAKPSDIETVNLLPEKWVKKYELEKRKVQIWSLTLAISYFVWITFFATLGVFLYMQQQIASLKTADTLLRKSDPEKVKIITQVQQVNLLSDRVSKISDTTVFPQIILNDIYNARPEEVSISRYKVNLDSGEIGLAGVSKDRISLIIYKQKLEEVQNFSLVDIPIASLEVQEDLGFTMTFSYLPVSSKDIQRGVKK